MPTETVRQRGAALRRRAEAQVRNMEYHDPAALSPEEAGRLLHELRVRQIELQMQNEELHRARVELEGARARYFDLYHLAPVGYLTLSEKGLILEANLRAAALLGMASGTLVKRSLGRFILTADSDVYSRHHRLLFQTGEPQACEVRLAPRHAGAAITWVRLELTLAQDEQRQATVCRVILSDITERRAAEDALRASESRYRDLYENAPVAYFSVGPDGRIRRCNRRAAQMLGYTIEQLVGRPVFDLYADTLHGKAKASQVFRRFLDGEPVADEELQMTTADGTLIWISLSVTAIRDAAGQVVESRSTVIDITGRKEVAALLEARVQARTRDLEAEVARRQVVEAEFRDLNATLEQRVAERTEALRASEERYRMLMMLSPDGVSVSDQTGHIWACNEQFAHMHGYDHSAEMIGRNAQEFARPEAFAGLYREVAAALERGESVARDIECEVLRRDGSPFSTEYSIALVPWPDAPYGVAFLSNIRDVTKRRELVAELEQHRDRLEELVQVRTRELQAEITERAAAEAALQRSEASLKAAERIAHVGSWELDPTTGEVRLSDELRRLYGFGFEARTFTLVDIDNAIHPDDRAMIKAARQRALQLDQSYSNQYRIVLPGGETRLVYISGEIHRDATGQPTHAFGMAQDITEQEQARQALDQRIRELTSLQDLSHPISLKCSLEETVRIHLERIVSFAGLDMAQVFLLREGRLHLAGVCTDLASPAAQAQVLDVGECLCGLAVQDGRTVYAGEVDCDPRCARKHCHTCGLHSLAALPLRGGETIIGALAVGSVASDAFADRLTFLETVADLIGLRLQNVLLHREIQARAAGLEETVIERTRELQTERDRTQAILETVGESVVVTDLDGQVLFINPATTALTGHARDEELGQPLWHGWTQQARTEIWPEAQAALRSGQAWHGEISGLRKNGAVYSAALTGTPLYDADAAPEPVGVVWAQRDITALKETARLKDQFVSNVSHELRTPISIIALGCDNLEAFHDRLNERQCLEILHDIREQSQRLSSIVADTLQISQIDARRVPIEKRRLDLARLVREEADGLRPLIGQRGQRLSVSAAAVVMVQGNEIQLRRVVRNLLDNAIKYTLAGRQVSCTCETRTGAASLIPAAAPLATAAWAMVEVTDEGIGIAAQDLPYLFERFYRVNVESEVPGTGLGLSIAQELVRLHGGWINVASTLGQGSTFTVYLPLAEEDCY